VLESASGRRGSVRTQPDPVRIPTGAFHPRRIGCARGTFSLIGGTDGNPSRFISLLVALQEAFSSSALAQVNRPGMDVAQRGRGGKPFGPPQAGTGRPFCSWPYLGQSAKLSDIDTPAWRNGESLRVRYFSSRHPSLCRARTSRLTFQPCSLLRNDEPKFRRNDGGVRAAAKADPP